MASSHQENNSNLTELGLGPRQLVLPGLSVYPTGGS